jgi:hypothetical protein
MFLSLDVSDEQLTTLIELTGQSDPALAIHAAIRDYIGYAKRMRLKGLAGRVQMTDNWRDLEAVELAEQSHVNRTSAD